MKEKIKLFIIENLWAVVAGVGAACFIAGAVLL